MSPPELVTNDVVILSVDAHSQKGDKKKPSKKSVSKTLKDKEKQVSVT